MSTSLKYFISLHQIINIVLLKSIPISIRVIKSVNCGTDGLLITLDNRQGFYMIVEKYVRFVNVTYVRM